MASIDSDQAESQADTSVRFVSRWYAKTGLEAVMGATVVLAGLLAVLGGLSYRYSESIADFYRNVQETMIAWLGLGSVSLTIWLAVALGILIWRRRWVRRVNLWVASLAAMAVLLGLFAFVSPAGGWLGEFTLGGEVTLGGKTGSGITGPVGELFTGIPYWQGALRVAAVFAAGLAIAFPIFSADVGLALGRLSMFVYLFVVVGARGLVSGLNSMYRDDPSVQTDRKEPRPATPSTGLPPGATPSFSGADSSSVTTDMSYSSSDSLTVSAAPLALGPGVGPASELEGEGKGDEEELQAVENVQLEEALDADEAIAPPGLTGKFNRFWSEALEESQESPEVSSSPKGSNGAVKVEATSIDDAGEPASGGSRDAASEPILSPAEDLWARPSTDMLMESLEGGISQDEMDDTAETIRRTLSEYGVEVEIGRVRPGPTVTMYGLIPGWVRRYKEVREKNEDGSPKIGESGRQVITRVESKTRVKVDSILSREKDLALALKTPSIRIETPVMGESLLGIEVPNPIANLVTLRSVMESKEFKALRAKALLPIALGKGSGGETVVVDLAKMPHLLIAGATGSGKSVCINTIVSCLILEKSPAEMRLLLIDPKRVELTPFNGVPHLLTPVVVETDQVVGLLKGLINEMLNRYRRMEELGVRNIEAYNKKMSEKMPFLVVAVDELADLMMSASFDVEQSLCRLAQLGRATGIHLIVATQRPSVDVITGLIKANFPSRISFGVTSQIDSRTILDSVGADKLLGRGDMLYLPLEASRPERVQGVFISDMEIETIMRFWRDTPWPPLPTVSLHTVGDGDSDEDDQGGRQDRGDRDELMGKAIELAHRYKKLSTSLLQRRMRIGYPRAARLMDELEEEGIIGPSDGSKSRDVIISSS